MPSMIDLMQDEASEAFRCGNFAEVSESCKLAMLARNRVYMYGKEPVPEPRYKESRPMVYRHILSFGGIEDGED